MEIGPIFRTMTQNKVGIGLLVIEIAVTMAVVLNCLMMVGGNMERLDTPTGLDEQNIMVLEIKSFGKSFAEDTYFEQVMDEDLAYIRSLPEVIDATPISPLPLVGGGSSTQFIAEGAPEATAVRTPVYGADNHFIQTLGLELAEGRTFTQDDLPPPRSTGPPPQDMPPTNVIITQALADVLYPDGNALGNRITSVDGTRVNVIVGIVEYMFTPYDNGRSGMEFRIVFFPGKPGSADGSLYLVRAEPDAYSSLFTGLEEKLTLSNGDRIITTQGLEEVRLQGMGFNTVIIKLLSIIMGLLLFVTALGIFGMTSFTVASRTRQIGTRRALGARKWEIVRYFLVEISIVAFIGIALGVGLAFLLNRLLVNQLTMANPLNLSMVLMGMLVLWLVGLVSAAWPAIRAAAVPPVVATRSV